MLAHARGGNLVEPDLEARGHPLHEGHLLVALEPLHRGVGLLGLDLVEEAVALPDRVVEFGVSVADLFAVEEALREKRDKRSF